MMQRYSVFLCPSSADFDYSSALIRELCEKNGEHPFEPHITVCSGEYDDPDVLKGVVTAALSGIQPLILLTRKIGYSKAYFRSLFIEFEENPTLMEMRGRILCGLKIEPVDDFVPHLSLLYSEMPLSQKQALAKRLVLVKQQIHCDEVKIVTPQNLEMGWRDTGQWQTFYCVRLGADS